MRIFTLALSLLLIAASAPQPMLVGTWQGIVKGPGGITRRIMQITKQGGTYNVVIHSLDESDVPITTKNVSVRGNAVTMKFDMNTSPWDDYHRLFNAKLSADGKTLDGGWRIPKYPPIHVTYTKVPHATWTIVEPKIKYVEVQPGVKIETMDWGGTGRPLLWLAGLGNTGHDFYTIVPSLVKRYHLYSMTRRGFGASSKPAATAANYSVDRLGDDVIAVMDALKLNKPIVMGHSIAGEELSDVGTRFANRVSALIYVDAGYWYAFDSGNKPKNPVETPPPGEPPMPPISKAIIENGRSWRPRQIRHFRTDVQITGGTMNAVEERIALDDGAQTIVERWGSHGPVMLCVHGMTSSRKSWERFAEHYADRTRIYAYDQRGHGDSAGTNGPMTLHRALLDLHNVMQRIGEPVDTLVGHSWGGAVAILGGRRFDAKRVIAIDPMIRQVDDRWYDEFLADLETLFAKKGEDRDAAVASEYSQLGWGEIDIERKKHAVRSMTIEPIDRLRKENPPESWDLRRDLENYPKPLLLAIAQEDDSIIALEDLKTVRDRGGANIAIRVFEGQGHNLHRTGFEQFISEVDTFLART